MNSLQTNVSRDVQKVIQTLNKIHKTESLFGQKIRNNQISIQEIIQESNVDMEDEGRPNITNI